MGYPILQQNYKFIRKYTKDNINNVYNNSLKINISSKRDHNHNMDHIPAYEEKSITLSLI